MGFRHDIPRLELWLSAVNKDLNISSDNLYNLVLVFHAPLVYKVVPVTSHSGSRIGVCGRVKQVICDNPWVSHKSYAL